MKTRTLQQAILLCLLAIIPLLVQNCTYDELPEPEIEIPDTVSFDRDIIPIFETSCNSSTCHSTGGVPPDLSPDNAWISLTFFGYVDTDVPENSTLYRAIDGGSMERFTTPEDRALILKWIEQGALDN